MYHFKSNLQNLCQIFTFMKTKGFFTRYHFSRNWSSWCNGWYIKTLLPLLFSFPLLFLLFLPFHLILTNSTTNPTSPPTTLLSSTTTPPLSRSPSTLRSNYSIPHQLTRALDNGHFKSSSDQPWLKLSKFDTWYTKAPKFLLDLPASWFYL